MVSPTFSLVERPESRESNKDSLTLQYCASGEQDDYLVKAFAITNTPTYVFTPLGTLWRQGIRLSPEGFAVYGVTVTYGKKDREVGSYSFSFDTTGGTTKVTCARSHVETYSASGGATGRNPHKGFISVDESGKPQGADIVIPSLKLTVSVKHPLGIITIAQAKSLASITGSVNSAAFLEFEAGELLFIGASGSDGTDSEAEVSYQFVASQNVTGLSYGDITGIAKAGHQLLWVQPGDDTDDGEAVVRPKYVHVEEVYPTANFASVMGWS